VHDLVIIKNPADAGAKMGDAWAAAQVCPGLAMPMVSHIYGTDIYVW